MTENEKKTLLQAVGEQMAAPAATAAGADLKADPAYAKYTEEMISAFYTIRETADKAHLAQIAYMDRIVLLSGGTLTLTFSAFATISGHLKGIGRAAEHSNLVVAECWLLVGVILFGLLYS